MQTHAIAYRPTAKQALFHQSAADEVLYGGAAGGGKTAALAMEAAQRCLETPGLQAYLFRRSYRELTDTLILQARKFIPPQVARFNKSQMAMEFINGSRMHFRHCHTPGDRFLYAGVEIHALFIDELTPVSYTHLDVYKRQGLEYLNFIADMYGIDQQTRQAQMHKYLKMFDLEKAAGEQIKTYSHGMRQKLSLTGALIPNPPLWIMDEPMVGLDPLSQHLLKQEMRAHCERGNTIFFSTHVLEVAEKLCDRIAIFNKGEIVAIGTLEELRSGKKDESLEELFLQLTEGGETA